ncbi:MAG: TIGR03016 family PEP-CTERM system-associated outer membrane protein, partial [Gammaproteobacteria bacterium]|nr:TIGR03016 family PEP-CTERM system-associated outer membrane protein [Gammaproteobacteria bacterium]
DFRHRTRLLALSAGFDQEVTNTRQELFIPATTSTAGYLDQLYLSTFPDPRARQQAVDAVISKLGIPASLNAPVNYFSDQLFLQQRLQASVAVQGVRNIIIVNVFRTDREALVGDVLLPGFVNEQNSTKQTGTGLVWNWLISARDSWNLVAAYTRNTFPGTNRRDDLTTLQMGFTRQFQPRLSGSLSYRRRQSDSNRIGNDYTENAVFATLQMSF